MLINDSIARVGSWGKTHVLIGSIDFACAVVACGRRRVEPAAEGQEDLYGWQAQQGRVVCAAG